jgi:integrase
MAVMSTALTWQHVLLASGKTDLAELRKSKEDLMVAAKAPNTLKAYFHSWKVFSAWCSATEHTALPASSETVGLFLTWASQTYKHQTIVLSLSAINHFHRAEGLASPVDEEVKKLMSGIARRKARTQARAERAGKQRVTPDQLRRICRTLDDTGDPVKTRDRAIILLAFASAWRRSEISALTLENVIFEKQGIRLWLPFSKTDQEGEGREALIPYGGCEHTCPVRALQRWIEVRGQWRGPLFVRCNVWSGVLQEPLSGQGICGAVKRALARIGENPKDYGAHSLRSGMITAASEAGASIRSIMDRSGHRSIQIVMRYVKSSGRGFADNPLVGVL